MERFLDSLLGNVHGRVVICNVLDGLTDKVCAPEKVRLYFDWWMAFCEFHRCTTAAEYLNAMWHMLDPDTWRKDFRPGEDRPDFRFFAPIELERQELGNGEITTVLPGVVFRKILDIDCARQLGAKCVQIPIGSEGDGARAAIAELAAIPATEFKVTIKAGQAIGLGFFWVTPRSSLNGRLGSVRYGKADEARDALGLIHHQPSVALYAVHFATDVLMVRQGGRPTFVEAAAHRRFKAGRFRAGAADSPWGRTVDLAQLASEGRIEEGLEERVAAPLCPDDADAPLTLTFDPLGVVAMRRGVTVRDNDEAYAAYLMEGRTIDDLKSQLIRVLL